jgi:hypothetical protein
MRARQSFSAQARLLNVTEQTSPYNSINWSVAAMNDSGYGAFAHSTVEITRLAMFLCPSVRCISSRTAQARRRSAVWVRSPGEKSSPATLIDNRLCGSAGDGNMRRTIRSTSGLLSLGVLAALLSAPARLQAQTEVARDHRPNIVFILADDPGYATGIFGKWGLGELETSGLPNRQGFDDFFGFLNQAHAHN